MNAALLTLFAALALTLAAIGVYGVMSYSTAQRTGEIALRLALGAHPRDMLNLVWRHGLTLTIIGLASGFAAALAAGRALNALLFEVSALDPTTYATGLAVMLIVALLASYLPARRAMRTDPVLALRQE
jgi:putative ABC transport system permease protein